MKVILGILRRCSANVMQSRSRLVPLATRVDYVSASQGMDPELQRGGHPADGRGAERQAIAQQTMTDHKLIATSILGYMEG
ncbi:hypothetical protein E2C01_080345 [Portunus trituberculatus]|uniref:Uncharacterized protein n=1 Tax=Portunus trituberculatus TaxID=210409 RepID=A0A5B7IZC4_PORTR|nr:hypothetical protein [Portunus trituberculatus]